MTKSRIFLFLLLAFIIGVAVRSFFAIPYIFIWIWLLAAAMAVTFGMLRKKKHVAVYGFLLAAFLTGILRFDRVEKSQPDLSSFYGKPLLLQGIVWEEPERTQTLQRLKVKVGAVDGNNGRSHFYSLVTTRRYPLYSIGDELRIRGILVEPQNFSEFDYVSYLSREDIFSTISFPLVERINEGRGSKLKVTLSRLKHSFEANIERVLPEPHAAFLKGLILGERESLPKDLVDNLNRTGTTHVVALSGYNITILGRFFIAALLLLTVPFRFSFWIATLAIILFVLLTGASPSVVRAGIMGILVLVARREGRIYHMTNALAFAAAVMIFYSPRILRFDAAFQLSFLATLGLVYLSPRLEEKADRVSSFFKKLARKEEDFDPRFLHYPHKDYSLFTLKRVFIETISAQLMVLPLLIYLFGKISLVSPLSNILVLIAVPYSMGMGFVTGLLSFLWEPLGHFFGWLSWILLEYKLNIIEVLAKFPGASFKLGAWTVWPTVVVYVIIFWKSWRKPKRI